MTLGLAVVTALFDGTVILLTLACFACVLILLLILALTVPVDFSKWTAFFLVLFLVVFVYAVATIIVVQFLKLEVMIVFYSLIATTLLCLCMLLNLQVLFNGSIFELSPDDFIQGTVLMFADIM